jgi:metallo-beta-lactamase family protein
VGYQAAGTRGRTLVDGQKSVRMKGRDVRVAATIEKIDSMSAHADANEIMHWLSGFSVPPSLTCLVHGEPTALATLAERITREKQWTVHVAKHQEKIEL